MELLDVIAETCPSCGTSNPLEIVYGTPSAEMIEAQAAQRIFLAEIPLSDDAVAFRCRQQECNERWGVIDLED